MNHRSDPQAVEIMPREEKKSDYRASLKSMDTEETFDLLFYRPIGYQWARLGRKLGISPNAITWASIFLGIGSGILLYFNDFWLNLAGALLLVWANTFDSADGQLARITGQYSRIGRILDGISGDIWFITIYAAICLRENQTSELFMAHRWVIWTIAAVTGFFHATQAATADYYRQFHLYFVKGPEGSELDTASANKAKFNSLSWKNNFWKKLVLMFYTSYTLGQERRSPSMQCLHAELRKQFGNEVPTDFSEAFRAKSLPLMKYANILSFNTRAFALFAAILIFRRPWLYFAFELTALNLALIYMMVRHERICRTFTKQLKNGNY